VKRTGQQNGSALANLAKARYTSRREAAVVKVNMLEAKNQLSRLVKVALEGEDVVIASNGEPMVRLVPVARKGRLRGWGKLKRFRAGVDGAFTVDVDREIARALAGQS
jgi:prevent-host-death family protein